MNFNTLLYKILKLANAENMGKSRFVVLFFSVVAVLALVRCIFPGVAGHGDEVALATAMQDSLEMSDRQKPTVHATFVGSAFFNADGSEHRSRIYSVSSFQNTFNDLNDVQMESARRWGVSPVANREEADKRMHELVNIECSPYFYVDKLNSSIAYLVPKAAVLLNDIGRNYFDSLQIKGIPLHKVIITSVLRTKDDIRKLRTHNANATENSCHLYGTTFDLCYNRYVTVDDPDNPGRRPVRNDSLKWVLSEVLRDLRQLDRCYVKYEVKQGCFHITVR